MIKNFYKYNENIESQDYVEWHSLEYINNKFRQGYGSICPRGRDYIKENLVGKIVKFDIYRKNYETAYGDIGGFPTVIIEVKDVIIIDGRNYILVDVENDKYEPYFESMIYIVLNEKELIRYKKEIEERERKKEENRLKYSHLDPYGEDEWEE